MTDAEFDELVAAMQHARKDIKQCSFCFNTFEVADDSNQTGVCGLCQDQSRDRSLLCVVEKESDLEAIEKTKQYRGRYFILGGINGILKKEGLQNIRANELKERIGDDIKEVIVALNPTAEGEATVLYLERLLKPFDKKITRLGRGLPVGGELEYADDETLRSALEFRR